jgi:hypothetical protein
MINAVPILNDMKQGNALPLLLLNSPLEYTVAKSQENKDGL